MEFVVFERDDSALLVVLSLFQPPLACGSPAHLRVVGACDIDLERLSPRVSAELAQAGFAHVEGDDWQLLRPHLRPVAEAPHAGPASGVSA